MEVAARWAPKLRRRGQKTVRQRLSMLGSPDDEAGLGEGVQDAAKVGSIEADRAMVFRSDGRLWIFLTSNDIDRARISLGFNIRERYVMFSMFPTSVFKETSKTCIILKLIYGVFLFKVL